MSEQAAHAAGPPGSAALPQSLRSSSLGQSPQPKPRTASFSDDGCVAPNSLSNSVAASMSETSPAGRHPISDGGALIQKLPDNPRTIGHFTSAIFLAKVTLPRGGYNTGWNFLLLEIHALVHMTPSISLLAIALHGALSVSYTHLRAHET